MGTSYASAVINASADEVWAIVRDYGNLAEWAPSIESCEIEG
ncbi:MAG: SRPBCC family protein, partial [Actinomadura sp.]